MRTFLILTLIITMAGFTGPLAAADRPVVVLCQQDGVICRQGEESSALALNAERTFLEHFEVRTDELGRAALDFQGEAKIMLKSQTQARVDPDSITLQTGSGWMKFIKRGSTFKIKTPCAVLGIRGTTFRVDVKENQVTTVDLVEGRLAVESEGHAFILTGGQRVVCRPGTAPQVLLIPEDCAAEAQCFQPVLKPGLSLDNLQNHVELKDINKDK